MSIRKKATAAALGLAALFATGDAQASQHIGQTVAPAKLGSLSAEWWQWAFSFPADLVPLNKNGFNKNGKLKPRLLAKTRESCGLGQQDNIWFLGGTFAPNNVAEGPDEFRIEIQRQCVVPQGARLFFPIINAECSEIEGDGSTLQDLRSCVTSLIDGVSPRQLSASINGRFLRITRLNRLKSGLFPFQIPPGTWVSTGDNPDTPEDEGTFDPTVFNASKSFADGYFVLTKPLPVGTHTVVFTGAVGTFSLDVEYEVEVIPPTVP